MTQVVVTRDSAPGSVPCSGGMGGPGVTAEAGKQEEEAMPEVTGMGDGAKLAAGVKEGAGSWSSPGFCCGCCDSCSPPWAGVFKFGGDGWRWVQHLMGQ